MSKLNFKKASTEIVKMDVGDQLVGQFKGKSVRPWIDPETGEQKDITQYHFLGLDKDEKPNDDLKIVLFADAGLQNVFNTENIKEDTICMIKKLEKITRGKKQINQYELFTAQ